jgi:hypothetical protein
MEIERAGSQPSGKGPADWFTGTVRIDPLFSPPDPARVGGASVTFEPDVSGLIRRPRQSYTCNRTNRSRRREDEREAWISGSG